MTQREPARRIVFRGHGFPRRSRPDTLEPNPEARADRRTVRQYPARQGGEADHIEPELDVVRRFLAALSTAIGEHRDDLRAW